VPKELQAEIDGLLGLWADVVARPIDAQAA
jgi:hypothetical protein